VAENYLLEMVEGRYGSFAYRVCATRPLWSCYESSDYHYYAVTDDFGNLVQIGSAKKFRDY
jgi:hypothetical protein